MIQTKKPSLETVKAVLSEIKADAAIMSWFDDEMLACFLEIAKACIADGKESTAKSVALAFWAGWHARGSVDDKAALDSIAQAD